MLSRNRSNMNLWSIFTFGPVGAGAPDQPLPPCGLRYSEFGCFQEPDDRKLWSIFISGLIGATVSIIPMCIRHAECSLLKEERRELMMAGQEMIQGNTIQQFHQDGWYRETDITHQLVD